MLPDQALPSFNLAFNPDHYKTILPNLSYPSRPITHTPWSGPSAPFFSKTTRPEMAIAASSPNIQVPIPTTASIYFDTSLVPDAFHGVGMLIWHKLSVIVRKLKLIKQRLFGV